MMASGGAEANDAAEVVAARFLTAPPGWTKLVAPKKTGFATRNEVVFVAPTGEQIRSQRQLVRYLKLHPGGPSIKEFNWLTEELRRSTRFNAVSTSISKATETPPWKRKNTSSSKKRTRGKKDDTDGEVEGEEKEDDADGEETKASEEVEMIDAGDKIKGDVSTEKLVTAGDAEKDSGPKTEEKMDEMSIENLENQEANEKDEEVVNKSLTAPALEEREEEAEKQALETEAPSKRENKGESEKQPAEPEAPSKLENNEVDYKLTSDAKEEQVGSDSVLKPGLEENKELPDKLATMPEVLPTASSENKVENVEGTIPDGGGKVEKESEEAKVGKDCPAEEASTEKSTRPEESIANNYSLEQNQDGTKPIDNHSLSCEETSRAQGNST